MKLILLNIIRFFGILGIILIFFLISLTSCSDNIEDLIKEENNNNVTTEDDLPVLSFATSSSYTLNENETVHQVNIILSESSAETITVTVTDLLTGSAIAGTDYSYIGWSPPEIIIFNPGETLKTISITPIQDTVHEGVSGTIFLELSAPNNAELGMNSHQVIIYDDDGLPTIPTVSFAASMSYTPNEDANPHDIAIMLSQSSVITVTVTVSDLHTGTASYGIDYNYTGWSSPQIITFDPGETLKTISITPVQDIIDEGSGETIILELSSPTNAELGASSHILTITDDDDDSGWIKLDDVPTTARAGAATAVYGDWLYVYGGETYSGVVLNDFWRYNLTTGDYVILSNDPGPRAYATLSELNGKLYLFGGKIDVSGTLYNDKLDGLYYYDTSLNTWDSFSGSDTTGPFPDQKAYHVAIPIYNSAGPVERIYLHGGKNNDDILHKIDLITYNWQTPQYEISYTRNEHSAVYYDNNIYFFGGYDSGTYYNDLWKFNIMSSAFDEVISIGITIIPVRSGISIIEHNGKIYVFGGKNGTAYLDDLWSYSLAGNTWTKISTAPFKRCFYSAVKYNNSLIIFGGYYLNSQSQKVYSSEVWQYNLP